MQHIDYFLTPVSPWVHLAGQRPAELAARHGLELRYKPVDPAALFARTGGLMLSERHESRQAYRLQELRRQSAKLGVPLVIKPAHFPTNAAPASYAIIAAQESGQAGDIHALVQSLTRACWEQERDIAEDDVIRDCLARAGFDPGLAMSGLLTGAEIYGRNLEEAVRRGVFGFPFFMVDEEKFWGQDRIEDLALFLDGKL
ncbi:MAG: 2-hydroxychromene-2-carboxylate isomerase [Rhodobacteraceae bacterium HLUCCA12]|nr:MAG: 2-hydroxychromene-2-carboxylate isomerase [Rhodobacteraceae bacterium HLUCCA12]